MQSTVFSGVCDIGEGVLYQAFTQWTWHGDTGAADGSSTVSTSARHKESECHKSYTSFSHLGKPVCLRMFRFLYGIGTKRLKNLMRSLKENGLAPRVHGNTKRRPKHALPFSSTEYVVRFLFTYAKQHALLLPRRVPGYSRSDIQPLPSSMSKRAVWSVPRSSWGCRWDIQLHTPPSVFCGEH